MFPGTPVAVFMNVPGKVQAFPRNKWARKKWFSWSPQKQLKDSVPLPVPILHVAPSFKKAWTVSDPEVKGDLAASHTRAFLNTATGATNSRDLNTIFLTLILNVSPHECSRNWSCWLITVNMCRFSQGVFPCVILWTLRHSNNFSKIARGILCQASAPFSG